jgi:hypothetical protein
MSTEKAERKSDFITADKLIEGQIDKRVLDNLRLSLAKRDVSLVLRTIRDALLLNGIFVDRIKEVVITDSGVVVYSDHLRVTLIPLKDTWVALL